MRLNSLQIEFGKFREVIREGFASLIHLPDLTLTIELENTRRQLAVD